VTQQGGCDPTYNFSVQIAAGLITLPGFAGLSGHVAESGAVQASVSTSGTQVTALGNLASSGGRGHWNSRSNDGTCAGYWTAQRGGALSDGPRRPAAPCTATDLRDRH
jgi:hypothetical protein